MTCYSLPGIKAIGFFDANELPTDAQLMAKVGLAIPVTAQVSWINILPGALASVSDKIYSSDSQVSAVLSFSSQDAPRLPANPAFVVLDVAGYCRVLGSKVPPFPVIERAWSSGLPGGEPRKFSIKVSLSGIFPLMKCSVL